MSKACACLTQRSIFPRSYSQRSNGASSGITWPLEETSRGASWRLNAARDWDWRQMRGGTWRSDWSEVVHWCKPMGLLGVGVCGMWTLIWIHEWSWRSWQGRRDKARASFKRWSVGITATLLRGGLINRWCLIRFAWTNSVKCRDKQGSGH